MKNVLIISHAMELGGAERAMLGLLSSFDTEKYDVELFLCRHKGELFDQIPKNIKLLPEIKEYSCLAVPITDVIKKGCFSVAYGRFLGKMKAKRFVSRRKIQGEGVYLEYSHKYVKKYMPDISDKEYDLVISFLTPHYFGIEKCRGKKKIAWIHTDYSALDVDEISEEKMWGSYDNIVSISDDVSQAFVSRFPALKDKLVRIDNIISADGIVSASQEDQNEIVNNGKTVILSCGRVTEGKNFRSIPKMCAYILSRGHDIMWYIVGDGPDSEAVRENISAEKMEERVIMLGSKANPYPYIAACDVYVQPSFYEGKAVAVREAQILGKPVVITAYPTAQSQLTDGFDGIIAPLDNEGCAEKICSLLSDKAVLDKLSENCKNSVYSNETEIEKIYSLMR